MNAVSMQVAEKYVDAFGNLAKTNNTVLLPSNPGDVSGMVSQVCDMCQIKQFNYKNLYFVIEDMGK